MIERTHLPPRNVNSRSSGLGHRAKAIKLRAKDLELVAKSAKPSMASRWAKMLLWFGCLQDRANLRAVSNTLLRRAAAGKVTVSMTCPNSWQAGVMACWHDCMPAQQQASALSHRPGRRVPAS